MAGPKFLEGLAGKEGNMRGGSRSGAGRKTILIDLVDLEKLASVSLPFFACIQSADHTFRVRAGPPDRYRETRT
jgi:hypothetical protein